MIFSGVHEVIFMFVFLCLAFIAICLAFVTPNVYPKSFFGLMAVACIYKCFCYRKDELADFSKKLESQRNLAETARRNRERLEKRREEQRILAETEWQNREPIAGERRKGEEDRRLERERRDREIQEILDTNERYAKECADREAKQQWTQYYESRSMAEIAVMSGIEFEKWLKVLMTKMGYRVTMTPANDQGGDLVCEATDGTKFVVQAKRSKYPVGNRAVQELLGAMLFYDCQAGMIVTNRSFTPAARELAKKHPRITLNDAAWLQDQMLKLFPPDVPEFDWDVYNKTVKGFR
jgi:restriction endonuclease Mrr